MTVHSGSPAMAQQNYYKADLRDLKFLLFEQFRLDELLGKPPFEHWGREECEAVIEQVYEWVKETTGPLNSSGDTEGCRLENGAVRTPAGFKEAWKSLYAAGWRGLAVEERFGGQGGPFSLAIACEEMHCGANIAFNMYPALTQGAADVIMTFGTPEQVTTYVPKMLNGTWAGTMRLTEAHAGSDVGSALTTAKKRTDGTYDIKGTKSFISSGDHALPPNIVHMVLARTPDAPPGTKGLSLFIVPKIRPDGKSNDVSVGSIEHKMGIKGSSTAVLNVGDN